MPRYRIAIAVLAGTLALTARAQEVPPAPAAPSASAPSLDRLWWMASTWQGTLLGGTFEEHRLDPAVELRAEARETRVRRGAEEPAYQDDTQATSDDG